MVPGQVILDAALLESDSHGLHTVSLQTPAELHNAQAVWFDATLGWVTPNENLVRKQSTLDKIAPVVFIGVMTWATAGALGIAGGAGVATGAGIGAGTGVVGAMTAGAAFGAISGFYSGLVFEGRIDLGGMFRGALTGAITAGVSEHFGLNDMGVTRGLNEQGQSIVTGINYAQRALAVTGQATLQGALQEISGGNFRDGFTAGLAQGLGAEIARGLELQINQLAGGDNPSIDAAQAGALRQFARVAQSAVSILANPDDPGHAFAMTFVNGLVGDVQGGLDVRSLQGQGPWSDAGYRNGSDIESDNAHDARRSEEWIGQNDAILARRGSESGAHGTGNRSDDQYPANAPVASSSAEAVFDGIGGLRPGVVDLDLALEEQQAQLQARLVAEGLGQDQAERLAADHFATSILIRDEAAREARQAESSDQARAEIDAFEPGSASELLADSGARVTSDAGTPSPRWVRLGESLDRLTQVDTPFLVERNQQFLRAQIGRYEQLEAQAADNGDVLLQRSLASERALFEVTLTRLDSRLLQIDYGAAALRYADRLAARPGAPHTHQEILQATQRFVAGTSVPGNAADEYVRRQMADEDTRLYLTVMGGGSIAALVGQDGSGTGSPRLQRIPNGSAQVPGTAYRYDFDSLGRVDTASADLQLGAGTRSGTQQRAAGGSDRLGSDDGGHIVGNRFRPPSEEFNLFAQDRSFNRGLYNRMESRWADALAAGQTVRVSWKFHFDGSNTRPDRLDITYQIGDLPPTIEQFKNSPRGGR